MRGIIGGFGSFFAEAFSPPVRTFRHYSFYKLRKDLIAGMTVSVVEVPQAMAYALIAGVPPQYGIYTSIIQGIVGALLSSSEHMTTGPTNTQALLIASAVQALHPGSPQQYLELVFCLTLLKGLIQLAFAFARMGDLVRYVSRPVIVGLTAGAGVLILTGQLAGFLGVQTHRQATDWHGAIGSFQRLAPVLDQTNWRAVMIGAICLVIILVGRRISKFIPGALISAVLAAGMVGLCHWSGELPIIGQLPSGFAHFHVPELTLDRATALAGGALALAVMGMIESVAIAKSIAGHTGEKISANQEFFAQGFKNALTGFFQCIPGSGSFTRSALDYAAGAETRFAAVYNACFVAAIYFLFSDYARLIPLSALAAILFVVAWGLIDFGAIRRIFRSNRTDAAVLGITFAATVVLPLEYAIFTGVLLNLALFVRTVSRLRISRMVPSADGFMESDAPAGGSRDIVVLNVEGPLFFSLAGELEEYLQEIAHSKTRAVVLRLKRSQTVDTSILAVLEKFARDYRSQGGYLLLCGVKPDLMNQLRAYGLLDVIGQENIFAASNQQLFDSTRKAIERGRALIQQAAETTSSVSAIHYMI